MYDVVVVGDTAWDTVVPLHGDLEFDSDTNATIYQGMGGQGLNMAIAAAELGSSTALVTQVGCDMLSQTLLVHIRRAGIHLVSTTQEDPLTRVVAIVREDGERALLTDPGVGPLASPDDSIHGKVLLISGYLVDRPGGVERIGEWLQWARRHKMTRLVDAAHARLSDRLTGILSQVDWILANEREWQALGRPDDIACLIKRGKEGIQLRKGRHLMDVGIHASGPVVDTTGAGDAVAGGFAASLAQGMGVRKAAEIAVQRGFQACLHLGSIKL